MSSHNERTLELAQRLVTGLLTCPLTTQNDQPARDEQIPGLFTDAREEAGSTRAYLDVLHLGVTLACSAAASALASHPKADGMTYAELTPTAASLITALIETGRR